MTKIDKEKIIITLNQHYEGQIDFTDMSDDDLLVVYFNSGLFHEHYGDDADIDNYQIGDTS